MRIWPTSLSVRRQRLGADDIPKVAPGAGLRVDRLIPGQLHSQVVQIETPGEMALDVTDLVGSIVADGAVQRSTTVALLVERSEGVTVSGHEVGPDCLVVFRPGSRIRVSSAARFTYAGVVMPDAHWIAAVDDLRCGQLPANAAGAQVVRLSAGESAALKSQVRALVEAASDESSGTSHFEADLQDYIADLVESSADGRHTYVALDRSPKARQRQAHAARDHIVSNLSGPLAASSLPRIVGTSRRQLEYAFRETFGLGPREFIHVTRLNEVRRELLARRNDGATVTDVAFAWGINHLGRFAASYRQLFGESPAETLARNKRGTD